MKTYISLTNMGMVAVMAKNKKEAHKKVTDKGYKASKSQVLISSIHYDFITSIIKI